MSMDKTLSPYAKTAIKKILIDRAAAKIDEAVEQCEFHPSYGFDINLQLGINQDIVKLLWYYESILFDTQEIDGSSEQSPDGIHRHGDDGSGPRTARDMADSDPASGQQIGTEQGVETIRFIAKTTPSRED